MAAKSNASKKQENKEKNYRSRYDVNRPCYRKDKTHYVYMEWVEPEDGAEGYYIEHVFTVGEDGVTLELLDYLQETDNGEVQDQEDDARNAEELAKNMPTHAKSPEEELYSDEKEGQSALSREFDEKVKPHLSESQKNLIYDRFGMDKSLEQIAKESPVKADGSHISHQAVSNKLNRVFAKVKKHMPQE